MVATVVFFIRIQGRFLSQHGMLAVSFETASRDTKTLNWSRTVSKFYAWQVVSLMNEQPSQFLLPKQTCSLLFATTNWSHKVKNSKHQPIWEFLYRIHRRRDIRDTGFGFSDFDAFRTAQHIYFFFVVHVGWLHVFKEIWRCIFNKEPAKQPLVLLL